MAVTLMCIGIPILRPLYRRAVYGSNFSSDRYYKKHGDGTDERSYDLRNMPQSKSATESGNNRGFPSADPKLGIRGPTTITQIAGDNQSDESILGPEFRGSMADNQNTHGIQVKQDVHVDWTKGAV